MNKMEESKCGVIINDEWRVLLMEGRREGEKGGRERKVCKETII